jgi:hypothetical protein
MNEKRKDAAGFAVPENPLAMKWSVKFVGTINGRRTDIDNPLIISIDEKLVSVGDGVLPEDPVLVAVGRNLHLDSRRTFQALSSVSLIAPKLIIEKEALSIRALAIGDPKADEAVPAFVIDVDKASKDVFGARLNKENALFLREYPNEPNLNPDGLIASRAGTSIDPALRRLVRIGIESRDGLLRGELLLRSLILSAFLAIGDARRNPIRSEGFRRSIGADSPESIRLHESVRRDLDVAEGFLDHAVSRLPARTVRPYLARTRATEWTERLAIGAKPLAPHPDERKIDGAAIKAVELLAETKDNGFRRLTDCLKSTLRENEREMFDEAIKIGIRERGISRERIVGNGFDGDSQRSGHEKLADESLARTFAELLLDR